MVRICKRGFVSPAKNLVRESKTGLDAIVSMIDARGL